MEITHSCLTFLKRTEIICFIFFSIFFLFHTHKTVIENLSHNPIYSETQILLIGPNRCNACGCSCPHTAKIHTHTHTHTHFSSGLNAGDSICTQQSIKALLERIALFKRNSYCRKLLGCELRWPDQTFDGWFFLLLFCYDNDWSL